MSKSLKLDNQLCFALYAASRTMTAAYKPLLKELDLTYPQYLVLLLLWERHRGNVDSACTVTFLCEKLMLDTGTVTPLLKRMSEKGLLTRSRDKSDERVVMIALTEAGAALEEKALEVPGRLACQSDYPARKVQELRSELMTLIHSFK